MAPAQEDKRERHNQKNKPAVGEQRSTPAYRLDRHDTERGEQKLPERARGSGKSDAERPPRIGEELSKSAEHDIEARAGETEPEQDARPIEVGLRAGVAH